MRVLPRRKFRLSLYMRTVNCASARWSYAVFATTVLLALFGSVMGRTQTGPAVENIVTVAGNGTPGFSGDGNAAVLAALNNPNQVAFDQSGNMYIADTSNYVIRKVTAADGKIATIVGTPGVAGTAGTIGDGGLASNARLVLPQAIAVNFNGDMFISDGDSIRKVTAATGIITTMTITGGTPGSGCGGGGCTTYTLHGGVALALDNANTLYIADAAHHEVLKMRTDGSSLGLVAGTGAPGFSGDGGDGRNAQLNSPEGVAVNSGGEIYIADTGNCVVRAVNPNTGAIYTLAGTPNKCGFAGDGGSPGLAKLNYPRSVAATNLGIVYVADTLNQTIRKIVPTVNITTVAGIPGMAGPYGDGGPATAGKLNTPSGLALDSADNLYITDIGNQRIREVGSVTGTTATPVFNPPPDIYPTQQSVSITDATAGATIYYTIDGSAPTTSSSVYGGPILVSSSETILAIASANGMQSAVATGVYTIASQIITTVAGNGTAGYSGDGSAATAAELSRPWGAAMDASGNLYIADYINSVVRKVSYDGTITTVVGDGYTGYIGDGGPGWNARLNGPTGVAFDASGNLYIADFGNSVVRKLTPDGIISTVAGNHQSGYSGDGGPATSAQMITPIAVTVDSAGNLFIADVDGSSIRKVALDGTISTVAGNGTKGYNGDGISATSAELYDPEGVAVDAHGNLYIGDMNNQRVRKVTPGGIISTVAGTGQYGYSGESGPATSAKISAPAGLALDAAGNLYIADAIDLIVLKVNTSGTISTVAGIGTQGYSGDGGPATSAQLNYFYGVGVDTFGTLYIPDTQNNVVRRVGPASVPPAVATPTFDLAPGTYSGAPTVNITDSTAGATIYYTTDGTFPTTASTVYSGPITISATETIKAIAALSGYFQSPQATAAYTISVPIAPVINWPNPVPIAFGTPLDGTQLNATSNAAGVFAYTPGSGTVLGVGYHTLSLTFTPSDPTQYTPLTRTVSIQVTQGTPVPSPNITTVAGIKGSYGYTGDGGPATQAQLNEIGATAMDASGNLYIADRGNYRIRKVAPDGTITTVAGSSVWGYSGDEGPATAATMQDPNGIAVDSAGNLYIVDTYNYVVRKVTPDGIIHAFAGNHTSGNSGDGGPATSAQFTYAFGIAVDSAGNVYISDVWASVIRKVTPDGNISTVAGTGNYLYWGDGGKATDAGIKAPEGLAFDPSGNLYIAEYIDNVIRKVDTNGIITTVAGTNANAGVANTAGIGVAGYYGDGGPATSALLYNCRDVATDAAGNLYISDGYNYVVRKVSQDGSVNNGIITTIAGNGVFGYSGDGGPATSAEITYPGGISLDSSGNLYIADLYNNVVRKVGASTQQPIAPPPTFSPAGGAYTGVQTVQITDAIAGATIYYTTDGSTPTTSSILYSGSITVSATETVNAIATATGYTQSSVATASYTITKATQTISFGAPPTVAFTGTGTLIATATSGLTLTFGSATPAICSVTGNMVTGISRGLCTVTADQAGNASYSSAPEVTQTFTIGEGTINAVTPGSGKAGVQITISGVNFGLTPTAVQFRSGGVTTLATIVSGSDTSVTAIVPDMATGPANLLVTGSNGLNSNTFPFTILSSTPLITAVTPGSGKDGSQVIITGANFGAKPSWVNFTVGGSTLQAMIVSGSDTSITAIVPSITPGVGAIVVTAGNGINTNSYPFTVLSSAPAITAVTPASATPGSHVVITGINFSAAPSGAFFTIGGSTVAGAIVSGSDTSVTVIVPRLVPGSGSVAVANGASINSNSYPFTILQSSQTITFGAAPTMTYGGSGLVSAAATSGLPVAFTSATPSICRIIGNTVTGLAVGSCVVTANQAGDAYNSAAAAVQQSFTINPATLTITANSKTISVGQSLPVFDFIVTGLVNGDTSAALNGSPTASTSASATPSAGSYSITFAQGTLSAANYNFRFVSGTLTVVTPPTVTITAASALAKVAGEYQATIKLTNSGSAPADNVQIVTALLSSATGSPLPQALGTLTAGGGSATVILTFPASAGTSGTTVVEKITGTYTGGTFTTSIRIKLP